MTHRVHIVLVLLWIVEVLALSVGELLPASSLPFKHMPNDKLLHFGAYFIAAVLALFAFERKRMALWVAPGLIALGVALEYGQRFSPGRNFDVKDMVANAFGVGCGVAVGLLVRLVADALCVPRRQPYRGLQE